MTRLILTAALLALGAGCGSTGSQSSGSEPRPVAAAPATQPAASAKPINKFCPIERDNEVDPTVTCLYQGKVIGFCCEDCIPKFKANPEKYMKNLK